MKVYMPQGGTPANIKPYPAQRPLQVVARHWHASVGRYRLYCWFCSARSLGLLSEEPKPLHCERGPYPCGSTRLRPAELHSPWPRPLLRPAAQPDPSWSRHYHLLRP